MFVFCVIPGSFIYVLFMCFSWEVIAKFIGQHVEGSDKNAKDVLAKAKELQKNGKIFSKQTILLLQG